MKRFSEKLRVSKVKKVIHKAPVKAPSQKTHTFKVVNIHEFGYFRDQAHAQAVKKQILAKVGHAKFSPVKSTSKGLTFMSKTEYKQAVPANITPAMLKAHIIQQSPGVKSVTVTKV